MRLIATLMLIFIIGLLFMANTGQDNVFFQLKRDLPFGDKIGHFMLFGGLAMLANFAVRFRHVAGFTWLQYGSVAVLALSTLEEFSQIFITTRTFSLYDLAANFLGISLFTVLSIALGKAIPRYNQRLLQVTEP
ncbi:VanZ family protein [Thalassotalea ponticola]|uniref:VanZ family protein n=1 Tax=Thalassotalea ponticola TaxID=1523392 RepID=UPI0025B2AAF5|nr:VanZ family protein [Thalassotalea ponticola]MDN3652302.1 VanZ family protein [Thalassotalea ponticola]